MLTSKILRSNKKKKKKHFQLNQQKTHTHKKILHNFF